MHGLHGSRCWTGWAELIANERWSVYRAVLLNAKARSIPFALAGAFATATHTGVWRDTNDMDLYVLPEHHEEMQRLAEGLGLRDIYDQFPYDRDWTYRATDGQTIVECMWRMKNHRADVDLGWLTGWGEIAIRGIRMFVTPPEEMMWAKLYVLHRLRSDWPDVLTYIYHCGRGLEWQHLFDRLGPDVPLMGGALSVFSWLSPNRAASFPEWIWGKFGLLHPVAQAAGEPEQVRAAFLFGPEHSLSRPDRDAEPSEGRAIRC